MPDPMFEHEVYATAMTPDGMDGPEPDEPVLRVSTVGQADLCPGRVFHAGDPLYREEPSEAMLFGTACHALVESQVLHPDLPVRPSLIWSVIERTLEAEGLDPERWTVPDVWERDLGNMAAEWRAWCRTSGLGYPPNDDPGRRVEQPLLAPFGVLEDGRRMWLAGTPDLLLPARALGVDWKTANKGWPPSRAQGQNQQHAYTFLARTVLGVELRSWWFVVGNREKGRWERFEVGTSRVAQEGYLARAAALVGSMLAGQVTYHPKSGQTGKRGWWCSSVYCGAWAACPARFLGDAADMLGRDDD